MQNKHRDFFQESITLEISSEMPTIVTVVILCIVYFYVLFMPVDQYKHTVNTQ